MITSARTAAIATTQSSTTRRSCLSENNPIGHCSTAPPRIVMLISRPTPAASKPTWLAYTGARPQKPPSVSPEIPAAINGSGAMRASCSKSVAGMSGSAGCAWRVRVIGISALLMRMAASANSVKFIGVSRLNSCWAAASAPRLTAMYSANTWPRFSPLTCAFSQLSMTMYSVTSDTP